MFNYSFLIYRYTGIKIFYFDKKNFIKIITNLFIILVNLAMHFSTNIYREKNTLSRARAQYHITIIL